MLQKIPYLLAVLSVVGGVFISILFGVNEEMFIDRIHAGLAQNVKIQQITDETVKAAKISSETENSFHFFCFFSSGMSMSNSSSMVITNSTMSKLSAPKSSMNEDAGFTFSGSTASWSQIIVRTLSSVLADMSMSPIQPYG